MHEKRVTKPFCSFVKLSASPGRSTTMTLLSPAASRPALHTRSADDAFVTGKTKHAQVESVSLVYLNMGALSITSSAVGQTNATVVIACVDSTGLSQSIPPTPHVASKSNGWTATQLFFAAGSAFTTISLGVAADAVTTTSTSASFAVGQQVGYLQYGRSIACRYFISLCRGQLCLQCSHFCITFVHHVSAD